MVAPGDAERLETHREEVQLRAAVLKVDVGCPASGRQALVVVQLAAGDVDSLMSQSHRILA